MLVYMYCKYSAQCLKKIHVRVLGQVDFFCWASNFTAYFPNGQGSRKKWPNERAACKKDNLEFKFLSSLIVLKKPCFTTYHLLLLCKALCEALVNSTTRSSVANTY